jgi:tryptophanyl-tRNA synthetase
MSKSLDNAIMLSDSPDVVRTSVMKMFTDPNRVRADVPGVVDGNPVFVYHDAFNTDTDEVDDLKTRYRAGRVGDVEVKKKLIVALEKLLAPMRERRAGFAAQPDLIEDILHTGNNRMRSVARETIERVHAAMGLTYYRR